MYRDPSTRPGKRKGFRRVGVGLKYHSDREGFGRGLRGGLYGVEEEGSRTQNPEFLSLHPSDPGGPDGGSVDDETFLKVLSSSGRRPVRTT